MRLHQVQEHPCVFLGSLALSALSLAHVRLLIPRSPPGGGGRLVQGAQGEAGRALPSVDGVAHICPA